MASNSKNHFWKFEAFLVILVGLSGFAFLCAILFVLAVPVSTYQHGTGTVQFTNEMVFVAGVEGIVKDIRKSDFDSVVKGEAILTYANIDKSNESALLEWRISQSRKELERLRELKEMAAIRGELVEEKESVLNEMIANKSFLDRQSMESPRSGRIYFATSPSELLGSYISKGQILGSIYWDDEMVLKIEFPSDFIDRFRIGGPLVAYYRDPSSLVSRHLWAEVRSIAINKVAGKTILYASETGGRQLMAMKPGTRVKASVILGSRSFIEDVFGVDLERKFVPERVRKAFRAFARLMPGPGPSP